MDALKRGARGIAGVAVAAVLCLVAAAAQGASIRNVYFTNTPPPPPGQTYRDPGQLPGTPTTTFVKGQDDTAFLTIIFGDRDAHLITGELKGSNGRVVRKLNYQLNAVNIPANWRHARFRFPLEKLTPGEYTFDLVVDGEAKGAHSFTLKAP
jgi:hypothetical protein